MQNSVIIPTKSGARQATILSLFISLGAFVLAYNTVCLTQLGDLMKQKNNLTKEQFVYQLSIATSCLNLGALISPILYKKYVSIFGELKGLLIIDIIGTLAIIAEMIQLNFYILAISRFVLGFFIGISTTIIPVFINSITPPSMVGRLGTINQIMQTFGVVVAYVGGSLINDDVTDQMRWRIFIGCPVLFLIFRIFGLQFVYRFQSIEKHMERGQIQEIKRYCRLVYERDDEEILTFVKQLKNFKKISADNKSTFRRRFTIAIIVISSNQLTGVNAILFYAKQLFNKITNNDLDKSQLLIIILSLVQLLATYISSIIIDRIGRKKMIINGQAIIGICLIVVVFLDKIASQFVGNQICNYGVIGGIFLHLIVMNMTLGPCCVIYCTEIVQDITWIIITLKAFSLAIALTSQYMIQYLGIGYMFLIFFVLTLCAFLFLRTRVMETKGLTTQEIYASFEVKKNNEISPSDKRDKTSLLSVENEEESKMTQ